MTLSAALPRPGLTRVLVRGDLELLRENDGLPHSWSKGLVTGDRWWLLVAGEAVAYCKTTLDSSMPPEGVRLLLQDIEVRAEARGKGYASLLTQLVEEATGERLWSDGGFTQEGMARLKHLPIAPGYEAEACYRAQSFVTAWDSLEFRA